MRTKDKSKMTLKEISQYFEKDGNYFSIMRCMQKQKYNYIENLVKGNLFLSYQVYLEEMEEVKAKLVDMYYWLEERKKIMQFSHFLHNKEIFEHKNTFSSSCALVIFSPSSEFRTFTSFKKYSKVIKVFPKFQKSIDKKA